ncbi:tumor protein p63-regulated gene 1 protein [Synchiropus picturatus]
MAESENDPAAAELVLSPSNAPVKSRTAGPAQGSEGATAGLTELVVAGAPVGPVDQFKLRKFFVLRPGTLDQGIKDVEALVDRDADGTILSVWLMAEVDHWNNEKERLAIITDKLLMIFKYDFVMFICEQIQKIPLNFVDRITYGTFTFPRHSLLQREGEGLRVFWDRLREPSFTTRWNPFTNDLPFVTLTSHPVRNISEPLKKLCNVENFRDQLRDAAQKAHTLNPIPGKANGVLVLNQSILIEAYVGLMSFLGNGNKLGYCMARGKLGI